MEIDLIILENGRFVVVIPAPTVFYPRLRGLAREGPELFLQQYRTSLIIDEIQYASELLPYIKIRAD